MRRFIFTDEAGDFTFSRGDNIPNYFIVCSITVDACDIGDALLQLRRELQWEQLPLRDGFHASLDKQEVRDRVFHALTLHEIRVDATILEKPKAQPHIRSSREQFYRYAWYYHFRHIGPQIAPPNTELLITTASIGTKKGQAVYTAAVNDVVQQVLPNVTWVTAFTQAATDPCLQAADYCTWAIQRKWERKDERSYGIIKPAIHTEFDLWRRGTKLYY